MVDYVGLLRNDLVEQFKGKPAIDALNEAIGAQLNDLRRFFEDLRNLRSVQTAVGKQLDGVGDIAVLSRAEAGVLACINKSVYVLEDEDYRPFLIYKIWKNTNNCTYYDVIKAFRMFWDKPLYYREDPNVPATMIFESSVLSPEDNAQKLLTAPFIKAAGVAILVIATTENPEMAHTLPVSGFMGRGYMSTTLPEMDLGEDFVDTVSTIPASHNVTLTALPELDFRKDLACTLRPTQGAQNITQTKLPEMEE